MSFGLFDLILLIGITQGFFLALLLVRKEGNLNANKILAFLVFAYSIFILDALFIRSPLFEKYPHGVIILGELPLVFGPLHYLYAKYLINKQERFSYKEWLHFMPFIFFKLYTFRAFSMSTQELLEFIKYMHEYGDPVFELMGWVIAIQGLAYMILTLRLIREYDKTIKANYSTIDEINLNWLKNITLLALAVWIVVLVEQVLRSLDSRLFGENTQLIAMLTAIFIYILGYLGLSKTEIFSQKIITGQDEPGSGHLAKNELKKYQKSGLSGEKAKSIAKDLQLVMKLKKPYMHSDLTLMQLADELQVSAHNLSEVINVHMGQNFFDLINQYRVEQMKRMLIDPQKKHLTFLAMALEAGFSSKSSFNSIFKKHTGLTPSEYQKHANVSEYKKRA